MKIGLIDVDSHNFPNLCLMKLSGYHKALGDTVEWYNGFEHYDVVYKSRIFTDVYSKDDNRPIMAAKVICGGTGYNLTSALPDSVEHHYPDYSIYPQYQDTAYGFLTRGCPRHCGFCIVSKKEGLKSIKVADLHEFWKGQKNIKLLDPNLLASNDAESLLIQLAESKAWVDFTQGLDIRLITKETIHLLNQIKVKQIHFAWDDPNMDLIPYFQEFLKHSQIKNSRRRGVYVLCNYASNHEQDLYRVNQLRAMGYYPYVMIYDKPSAPAITKKLQRWVNNRRIFGSVPHFEDYLNYTKKEL